MTFEELWEEIAKLELLSNTAIKQIPSILSKGTKRKLARMTPQQVGKKLLDVIDEINHGSVESVENLLKKRM